MRTEVMYRDLPGGPLQLNFTDELPLCMLCTKCGMLSKSMFEDPSSHAFCSVCIFESSERKKIRCKYENKEVSVDEMMPAVDILTTVMDQLVYCPNRSGGNCCNKYCSLKDLEGHYLECERTKIFCLVCGEHVKGTEWETHVKSCPQQILQCRYCVVAVPRYKLEAHERVCNENRWAIRGSDEQFMRPTDLITPPEMTSQDLWKSTARGDKDTSAPDSNVASAFHTSMNVQTLQCPICNAKVKERNMNKHMDICRKRKAAPPSDSALKSAKETLEGGNRMEPISTPTQVSTAQLIPHEHVQQLQQRSTPNTATFLDGRQAPLSSYVTYETPESRYPSSEASQQYYVSQVLKVKPETTALAPNPAPIASDGEFAESNSSVSRVLGSPVEMQMKTGLSDEDSEPETSSSSEEHEAYPPGQPVRSSEDVDVAAITNCLNELAINDPDEEHPSCQQAQSEGTSQPTHSIQDDWSVISSQPSSSHHAQHETTGTVENSLATTFVTAPVQLMVNILSCGLASLVANFRPLDPVQECDSGVQRSQDHRYEDQTDSAFP